MTVKKIGSLERALISECVKDIPDFGKISKLFDMGANINAVNEFGECTASIIFEGYCSLYGRKLRSGYYAPALIELFISRGFDLRRHGLRVISELQNCCYDKYIRQAIVLILTKRSDAIKHHKAKIKKELCTLLPKVCKKALRPQAICAFLLR